MWKLLVNATYLQGDNIGDTVIGMGPRLAELCLAAYGGHFLRVKYAISDLSLQKGEFEALALFPDLASNILKCLDTEKNTRPLLEALAKSGFAPIATHTNTAVEMIVKLNIGGVVRRRSKEEIPSVALISWFHSASHSNFEPNPFSGTSLQRVA
jgi:hypothetical protein